MTALQGGARSAAFLLVGFFATAGLPPASAQELQTGKPIRMIVGLSAGGGTDVTARLIGQQMAQNMGTTVLVVEGVLPVSESTGDIVAPRNATRVSAAIPEGAPVTPTWYDFDGWRARALGTR